MNIIRRALLAAVLMAGITPVFAQAPAPVPALPDTERRTSYSITANTCVCALNFQLYGDSTDYQNWLEVFLNGVKVAYNDTSFGWTITVPTGSLATRARPISDAVLTFNSVQTGTVQIVGAQRPRRLTEVSESRGVAARDFNQFANTITAELREVWDRFLRTPRVPAGETLALLPPLSGRASMNACFDSGGNLAPCVGLSSGSIAAGAGIQFTGTNPTTISVSVASNPTTVAVSSRAVAATLDLHAFGVITTGGYAGPGDGGNASFHNVGTAPFIDSYITSFTTAGGSGYTNGSYFGVILTNTTKPFAIGTATVSGGVVGTPNIAGTPGGLCNVGDVYTAGSIPGGTGFSITVTGCSTPRGSFTDSVGTHFQIVYDGASPNIRQFGAVGDYNFANPDASATDNFNSIQAALWFAGFTNGSTGGGNFWGGRLWVPQGSFLACGGGSTSLIVPNGVALEGASNQASVIHMCDAFNSATHFVTLCDSNWHFACFDSVARNIQFSAKPTVTASGVTCMIYSNASQDMGGLYGVYVYAGGRCGVWFEKGYGGASTVHLDGVSITALSGLPQIRIGDTVASGLNFGSTIVNMKNIVLGGPSSGPTFQTGSGILIQGSFPNIENVHCEAMPICIEIGIPASANGELVRINNVNAGSGGAAPACTGVITLDGINNPGNTIIGQVPAGSCANVIQNGQSGGTNMTTPVLKAVTCVSGACS